MPSGALRGAWPRVVDNRTPAPYGVRLFFWNQNTMATAKTAAKKAVVSSTKTAAKAPVKAPAKVAPKAPAKAVKPVTKPVVKAALKAAAKAPAKVVKAPVAKAVPAKLKPIATAMNKTELIAHLAAQASVEPKAVKAVLAALEGAITASLHKKGARSFVLPGIVKLVAEDIAAKKRRFGKNPFTGADQWFAAKPASVRLKARPLKKAKDAAL
jgi:nucleoid DNA-binding protein